MNVFLVLISKCLQSKTIVEIWGLLNMDSAETTPNSLRPLFLTLVIIGIIGFLVWIAIPNFVRGGPGKNTVIVNHLRQIEAAKEEWALVNGYTNSTQLNRVLTPNDLSPFLLPQFTQQDFGDPICGERYYIGKLNECPEAILTRDLRERGSPKIWTLPKGTIVRAGTNFAGEFLLPGRKPWPALQ